MSNEPHQLSQASSAEDVRSDDVGLLSPVSAGSAVAAATGDTAVLRAMLTAESALVRALAELGLAPAGVAEVVDAAVTRLDLRSLALRARGGGNPVIPLVADLTAALADGDPEAAAYVHRGATSQDILDTAMMLVAVESLGLITADLERTAAALARLSAEHRDTVMPGRTLTQHAVPTTFGLKAAGWRSLVLDARDRVAATRAGLPVQLGGAAGTFAAFHAYAEADGAAPGVSSDAVPGSVPDPGLGLDRDLGLRLLAAYGRQTGLAEPRLPWHVLRTPIADLGAALAFTAGALGKIAADVLTLSRTEIGELSEGGGGPSSAMPHKANPVRATLIAAAARQVPALAGILFGSLVAEDERPAGAWHAEWQPLREALRLVGGAARQAGQLAEELRVRPERMRANVDLTGGLIVTERLAAVLGALIGRGEARSALSRASARAAEPGLDLHAALATEPQLRGLLAEEELRRLTDPAGYLGSSAALVDRALSEAP
ncbi:3-carboxy-cis,cis-muconate cycloisomerase [Streptacidiphilus sp. EB129]|uniref:3-carboxy-cis,cis-muconate cycloisomerase n=1 Tax=Streptacidiphilus sp. EB129 TaxID=3156262 RepID=UPI003512972F